MLPVLTEVRGGSNAVKIAPAGRSRKDECKEMRIGMTGNARIEMRWSLFAITENRSIDLPLVAYRKRMKSGNQNYKRKVEPLSNVLCS